MGKVKTAGIYFKVSKQEREQIRQKMESSGMRNMSAYIRKMCLDGMIVQIQPPELADCSRYLRSASNNLNQIARRINSGGGYYPDEIDDIRHALGESSHLFGNVLERLSTMK